MKKLMIAILAFGSISANAHPGDDELMTMIDTGSKLVIQKDINIPAHNKLLVKNGEIFKYFSQVEGNAPSCRFRVQDSNGNDFGRDVVVRAGERLVAFDRVSDELRGERIDFKTSKGNILHVSCWKGMKSGLGQGIPTIGAVKMVLNGLATLELVDPIEL